MVAYCSCISPQYSELLVNSLNRLYTTSLYRLEDLKYQLVLFVYMTYSYLTRGFNTN